MQELEVDRRILQRLEAAQDILDVGCGKGRLVNFLACETEKRVVGLDISNRGFAQARREADQAATSHLVECVRGDAQQMVAFEDGQFEAVTLTRALHHIKAPVAALQEVQRVLSPGGQVLIGDWALAEGQPREGCYRFTAGEMRRMVVEAGFRCVELEQIEPDLVLIVGKKEDK